MKKIGIIGGSGLEDLSADGLTFVKKIVYHTRETEYGETSPVAEFSIHDTRYYLMSRHGLDHSMSPSSVNYIANIKYLKDVGCDSIISITACGSLRPYMQLGDLVFPDQFIDFTHSRENSYYKNIIGNVKHTAMGKPIDSKLKHLLLNFTSKIEDTIIHSRGTVVTIEGPRFSTAAESRMYQIWGGDIVNMTSATEIALANELAIPIVVIAMVTDFDAWKEDDEHASWEVIKEVLSKNKHKVVQLLKYFINL